MARPREHDDATRDQLLVAAGRVLATEGASALSVRRLAEDVGVSTRAIYSLFGSKEGLVRAMFAAGFRGLADALGAVGERDDDPVGELRELAHAYRRSALARPHLYDVMFACPVPEFEPSAEDDALARSTLQRLRDAVARAVAAGRLHGDIDEVTVGLWALVHGLASLELGGVPDDLDVDRTWQTAVDAQLAGLARQG